MGLGGAAGTSIEAFDLTRDLVPLKVVMAAVFETLPNNQVGNLHRTQEREPGPWEFGTGINQEVGLPICLYASIPYPGYRELFTMILYL